MTASSISLPATRTPSSPGTTDAVVTTAGKLPARYVFHTVGPVYRDGKHDEPRLLASCYQTCMRLADQRDVATIAFPAISAGIYGYPLADAAAITSGAAAASSGKLI